MRPTHTNPAETAGDVALITVRDYGPGVSEDLLPKIFTPFFRVDVSRDNATGGVGLGLAIAQRAVHLHHGRLTRETWNPACWFRLSFRWWRKAGTSPPWKDSAGSVRVRVRRSVSPRV
jgi:nitrogen-specific signal transduction histidine kinase